MILFLTSHMGGNRFPPDANEPCPVLSENGFVDNLKKYWPQRAKVLLIASDPGEHVILDDIARAFSHTLPMAGLPVEYVLPLDDRNEEAASDLSRYDVIIHAGGHVPTQNEFFRKIGLKEKYRHFDGIVIGISAGTMNCASTVYAHPELDGEAVSPDYRRFIPGLGLTELQILPHFQYIRTLTLDGMKAIDEIAAWDSRGNTFLCLNDGSYALQTPESTTVFGEAYFLQDGVLTKICSEKEQTPLTAQAMKLLFTVDLKNYDPNGSIGRRPSVRGIIERDGRIAMMYSQKYGYYKLPGGGMEEGETLEETLIREVREESGLQLIPSSIRPFGRVQRIEKGGREAIFVQENYYFFCQAGADALPQTLDEYEQEERFTLAFISPEEAIGANEQVLRNPPPDKPRYAGMLERENRLLRMVMA